MIESESGPQPAQPVVRGRFGVKSRLRTSDEFKRVLRKGRRLAGPHLVLAAVRAPAQVSRLGLAVSRKVGHAPARARLRRLLREAFRAVRPSLTEALDLVVIAQRPWPGMALAEVAGEFEELVFRLRPRSA